MNRNVLKSPLPLRVTANNFFHEGWLHALLGCERRDFSDDGALVRNEDCEAYNDGYDTAIETPDINVASRICASMSRLGQLKVEANYGQLYSESPEPDKS